MTTFVQVATEADPIIRMTRDVAATAELLSDGVV